MRLSGRRTSSDPRHWSPPQQVAVFSLIGLSVAVYAAQLALEAARPALIAQYLGLSYRGVDQAYAWQFLSAMFLQPGFVSFFGGLFLLYFLGRDLATILGERHFLFLYLAGLVGGATAHRGRRRLSSAVAREVDRVANLAGDLARRETCCGRNGIRAGQPGG